MAFKFHCLDREADRDSPPSVRPGVLKTLPVAGPPSFTALLIAAVRAGGLAPLMVSMQVPLWKILKVGMAETPWARAMPDWLSTLTFAKATFFDWIKRPGEGETNNAIRTRSCEYQSWTLKYTFFKQILDQPELFRKKAVYDEKAQPLLAAANEAKSAVEDIEKRIARAEERSNTAAGERHNILLEKNEIFAEVDSAKAAVTKIEDKVHKQEEKIVEYVEHQIQVCPRVVAGWVSNYDDRFW